MISVRFAAFSAVMALAWSLGAATTTYQGPDGGDLAAPANWNGNPPQYDATTNPDTKLYFGGSPSKNYGVTLSQDLLSYSAGFVYGLDLNVNLNGKALQFVSDIEFDALSSHAYKDLYPGSDVVFRNGTLTLLSDDGLTRKKFNFFNSIAADRIGRNSSVTLDGVTGEGNFYSTATNCAVIVTNGTKWVGKYNTYDGAHYNRFIIAGAGTVFDFDNTSPVISGRGNDNASYNSFVVTDHAVATNLTGISTESFGAYVEFSDGAQVYLPSSYAFLLGTSNARRAASFKFTSGKKVSVKCFGPSYRGSDGLTEIGGEGTILETVGGYQSGFMWGTILSYYDGWRNRLWIHDGAVLTNCVGSVTIGYGTSAYTTLDMERNAVFHTPDYFSAAGSHSTLRIDTGSRLTCKRFGVSADGATAQTNLCWVGDKASVTVKEYAKLYGGKGSALVVSNGTFKTGSELTLGPGYDFVLAGVAPHVTIGESFNTSSDMTMVFDIPKEGFETAVDNPVIRSYYSNRTFKLKNNITPVFRMRDYAHKTGGKILLAQVAYGIEMDEDGLDRWKTALEEACGDIAKFKLYFTDQNTTSWKYTKLWLEVKPKKGFAILIR